MCILGYLIYRDNVCIRVDKVGGLELGNVETLVYGFRDGLDAGAQFLLDLVQVVSVGSHLVPRGCL